MTVAWAFSLALLIETGKGDLVLADYIDDLVVLPLDLDDKVPQLGIVEGFACLVNQLLGSFLDLLLRMVPWS